MTSRLDRAPELRSSWTDTESGTTEEARFLGPDGQRLLAFLHRPQGPPRAGVVICGSVYEDFQVNYRPQLLVARALARRGIAAVRFHYRGLGNSDEVAGGAVTFASMAEDAAMAAEWLTTETGVTELAWCGSRVGAILAAELALRSEGDPLVLWSPLLSGADFFRGMSRANKLVGVRAQARKRQTEGNVGADRLGTDEIVELLGNRVPRESYDDLRTRTLPTSGGARRVLLVQLSTGGVLTSQNEQVVAGWREGGAEVDVVHVTARQTWTVPDKWESVDAKPQTQQLVEEISQWVDATVRDSR